MEKEVKTLKQFISENEITGFTKVNETLISVVVDNTSYGLDSDTSNIQFGTVVTKITDFNITNDILTIDNVEYDINNINLI